MWNEAELIQVVAILADFTYFPSITLQSYAAAGGLNWIATAR